MSWSNNSKGIKTYAAIARQRKIDNKKERERLKKIRDFDKDDEINLNYKGKTFKEKVLRVYNKTYKVSFIDDYVLIGKESLSGYPNSVIKDITGDSRRYVGEEVRLTSS